ncbi:hypothetical protein DET59_106232 [Rossellomorea aquimaris]|uniref:Uncharacterized protein n=2 Tax=Rossellomorea aquimaris TaxID=189382 RepID=A0A366ERY4_9BACI|nr:hypothetical protein DET59_106232 [Rossellomorea aquimaris]
MKPMNAHKQDKNQRMRMAQSLYRKKKHNERKFKDSKVWTVFIVIAIVFSLFFLIVSELYFMDSGVPVPGFFRKIAEDLNN